MAEVGQRLRSGTYWLIYGHGRPVCTGDSPGSLLAKTFTDSRRKENSTKKQPPVTKTRATQRGSAKLPRERTSESHRESWTMRPVASPEPDSLRFIGFIQTRGSLRACETAACLSATLQPLLQEKLLSGRMASWTRGAVSIHPDTFRSPQQLRTFCAVVFILAESGSQTSRLRRLKLRPDNLQISATSRSSSWRSDSRDVPPLRRSRTAYYDILKVTPSATQSQIKTAYYQQSFIWHPDKNPANKEATERFAEVSEAYAVLGNVGLRRKYDRGMLSPSDLQTGGRPSSQEKPSRSTGPQQQQQQQQQRYQHQHRSRNFDFDAFYQGHYGEQLQRERYMRARKQQMEEEEKKRENMFNQKRLIDITVFMMMVMGGVIFVNLTKS